MAQSSANLRTKLLSRARALDDYLLYRAGLEWSLVEPIVIESREDLRSESLWHNRVEPYHHQVSNLITFCRRLPVTLLADDVGLGKTISAGLVISELVARSRVANILVVCPKMLGPQWQEELLTKFGIASEIAIGKDLKDAKPQTNGAVITTYHSARLYLDKIPEDRFQMLVLDEAHKLRNLFGVDPPPQVALKFRQVLSDRRFPFVLMLTATPLHNRLWDLYSLIDLLTVARGHENPFGSPGEFARRFIEDDRETARRLKNDARDDFRAIVYAYMSRVRRGDAKLYFPERVVQMHRVMPTQAELQLIDTIAVPIQELPALVQISILQALTSSPEALLAQLRNMARKGTVPEGLKDAVEQIVRAMPQSAKLKGLSELIHNLKGEDKSKWRLVVFTGRLETQTTIQIHLEKQGLRVGIINGSSGGRNQATLEAFRKDSPELHVLVSTEAGAEGLNLQVANVLVNYDLPWNPMIVEQRIGRIQRLASKHARVAIFNIMLQGTFEEFIVGRLMEKLQLASQAVGDVEALLEASGLDGEDGDAGSRSFEERIRELVVAALAKKNVEEATRKQEASIVEAKEALERERAAINDMLGSMDGADNAGPRAPSLPRASSALEPRLFVLKALEFLGAQVSELPQDLYLVEEGGGSERIRFDDATRTEVRSTLYRPGAIAFQRLVDRVTASGLHRVVDLDEAPFDWCKEQATRWMSEFGAGAPRVSLETVEKCFEGTAVVRVRATVAHDSYERLVDVNCSPNIHRVRPDSDGLARIGSTIQDATDVGLEAGALKAAASQDEAIAEFVRFYLERKVIEIRAAGQNERKQKKLDDEFTPKLEATLVAAEGRVFREIGVDLEFTLGSDHKYSASLLLRPSAGTILTAPEMGVCARTSRNVPTTCLERCDVSKAVVLREYLSRSAVSGRWALPEHIVTCSITGKLLLQEEAARSVVTGKWAQRTHLRTSEISGKMAEPDQFAWCEFTKTSALLSELRKSELSGKTYRSDEEMRSVVSGKAGHATEFVSCAVTGKAVSKEEAETCAISGKQVIPGILETCALTAQRVLPEELGECVVSGKRVLKSKLVQSSVSNALLLPESGVHSSDGLVCTPKEAKVCAWSGDVCHPTDVETCSLTGLEVSARYLTSEVPRALIVLAELLDGRTRGFEEPQLADNLSRRASQALGNDRCRVAGSIKSPDGQKLAVCVEVRTMLGLRVHHAGFLYAPKRGAIVGQWALGRRKGRQWVKDN